MDEDKIWLTIHVSAKVKDAMREALRDSDINTFAKALRIALDRVPEEPVMVKSNYADFSVSREGAGRKKEVIRFLLEAPYYNKIRAYADKADVSMSRVALHFLAQELGVTPQNIQSFDPSRTDVPATGDTDTSGWSNLIQPGTPNNLRRVLGVRPGELPGRDAGELLKSQEPKRKEELRRQNIRRPTYMKGPQTPDR